MADASANRTSTMVSAVLALLAVLAGGVANIIYAGHIGEAKVIVWLTTMAMMVVLLICIGRAIAGRWDGVLVDGRNRLSLSRLQMLGWTLLILSALITAIASNLAAGHAAIALSITIENPLLAAMGISAVSLAATPALLTLKGQDSSGRTMAATNPNSDCAGWLDIFSGDEEKDRNVPDLSKIQQFLVSLALIGGYGFAIGYLFLGLNPGQLFTAFPDMDDKIVWLLGISHAGYLSYKAASKPAASDAPASHAAPAAPAPTTPPPPPLPPPPPPPAG